MIQRLFNLTKSLKSSIVKNINISLKKVMYENGIWNN